MSESGRFPSWSPELARAALAGHKLLGLSLGALLYLVCLTGTVSVFREELRLWEAPFDEWTARLSPETASAVLARAVGDPASEADTVMLGLPTPARPYAMLSVFGDRTVRRAVGEDGTLSAPLPTPWTDFLVELHVDLHLPAIGGLIVGLLGVLLTSSILTGLVAHRKILLDAFRVRRSGAPRLFQADVHNRLGVWGLPFHVLIAVTGAFLALTPPVATLFAWYEQRDLADVAAVYEGRFETRSAENAGSPDVGAIIATMRVIAPEERVEHLVVHDPGTPQQTVDVETDVFPELAYAEVRRFTADGEYLGSRRYSDGPPGLQFFAASGTLHLGDFDFAGVHIVYVLLGLVLTVCCVTGVNMWFRSAVAKGHDVAGWDRLWRAVIWGVPFSLACAAIASLFPASDPVTSFYAVLALVFLSAMRRADVEAYDRVLRSGVALALAAVAIAFMMLRGGSILTAHGVTIGVLWLAPAAVLALSLPRLRALIGRIASPSRTA
jgi:uncharacterized iron-regulated membrane protein